MLTCLKLFTVVIVSAEKLRLFIRKNEDKKWCRWDLSPHIHTHKVVVLPTGLLELPTNPSSFKHLNVSFFLSAWYSCVYNTDIYVYWIQRHETSI